MDTITQARKRHTAKDGTKPQATGKLCSFCGGRLFDEEGRETHARMVKPKPRSVWARLLEAMRAGQPEETRRVCSMDARQRADGATVWSRRGLERAPFLPSMDPTRAR